MNKIEIESTNLEFIEDNQSTNEEVAAVSLNPFFKWVKFILTDDRPNLNNKRIPQEEFDNLVKTGVNAPIKMAANEIADGHDKALPLGVITALKKENNYIVGLAALWTMEREKDIEYIKDLYDKGQKLNLSWEIIYQNEVAEEDNVTALKGVALRATTLVGMPAYAGRTPIIEMASVTNTEGNSTLEDSNLEELEQAKSRIAELEALLTEKETALAEKEALLTEKETAIATITTELDSLSEFKRVVEEEKAANDKLAAIKQRFVEANIDKPDSYFADNREMLLSMSETSLDFMIQEFVSFASTVKNTSNSSTNKIPNFYGGSTSLDPRELGRKLRDRK